MEIYMKRLLSLFLSLALCLSLLSPAAYAAADGDEAAVLHISTADELRDLSSACMLDEYSVGLRVELDCDIDLGGEPFYPIPSFSGVFDGGGHTVSGFVLATDGSHQGLFRYLQEGGEIKNLHVIGRVEPDNSRSYVGGIVGTSWGTISGCSFDGTVTGLNYVGGIVGNSFGQVSSCRASGTVNGKRFTGGIAGESSGMITGCANSAAVNTSISEGSLEVDSLTLSGVTGFDLTGAEDSNVVSDTGGIVGFSSGLVENCRNTGDIGYPHYGYNVGGIAGRQSGCLRSCENLGSVCGRKDVAGIVGQMEPYLLLKDTESLADEIRILQGMVNAALANSNALSADAVEALHGIRSAASATLDEMLPDMPDIPSSPEPSPQPSDPPGGETPSEPPQEPAAQEPPAQDAPAEEAPAQEAAPQEASDLPQAAEPEALSAHFSLPSAVKLGPSRPGFVKFSSFDPGSLLPGSGSDVGSDYRSSLEENRQALSNEFEDLANIMRWSADVISSDLSGIAAQLSKVMLMMTDMISGNTIKNKYEDVSADEPEDSIQGRVYSCTNHGPIEADTNVGGIAGDMGIEYEFDLENELMNVIGSSTPLTSTFLSKCIASENINHGNISGKKDNIGGIAGQSQVGLVELCQNYGTIESTEGSYVGGIVGNSMTNVRRCYSMCRLDGEEYVGGIAGRAVKLQNCVSIASAGDVTACFGAVAGYAELTLDEDGNDNISGNIFVGEGIGAIDGISYGGKAEPVSFEQMLRTEGLPQNFGKLRLRFVADGRLVTELYFDYGGSVDPAKLPAVPAKEGFTGVWSEHDYDDLRFSSTIEAVYTPLQAALAADTRRGDSPLSVVLVEGAFGDRAKLRLTPYSGDGPSDEAGIPLEKWSLRIDGSDEQRCSVHFLEPEHTLKRSSIDIYVLSSSQWQKVPVTSDGSYLVFDAEGDSVVFCAVEHKDPEQVGALVAALCILLAVVLIIVVVERRRRKTPAASASAASSVGSPETKE